MIVVGWDVGGANIKAASLNLTSPDRVQVIQEPFALWREPHRLSATLIGIATRLNGCADTMAITMTAELADCFETKRAGVGFILDAFEAAFRGMPLRVYGTDGAFHSIADARRSPIDVAAANWMASATIVARLFPDAVFVDVGSTTTDIVPITGGQIKAGARTDPARLVSGELVYTGSLRTSVAAIVRSVPLNGSRCGVAAEYDLHPLR